MFYDNNKMFRLNDGTLMHTLWAEYAQAYWDDWHRWVDTTSFVKEVMDKWYIVRWFVRVENWEYTIFDQETIRPNECEAGGFIDMDRSIWTVDSASGMWITVEWSFYDLLTKQRSDYPFANSSYDPSDPSYLLDSNPFATEFPMWTTTVFFPEAKELIHVLTTSWEVTFTGATMPEIWWMESWRCNIYIYWEYEFTQGVNYNEWTDGDYDTIYIEWDIAEQVPWFGVVSIGNENYSFTCQNWMDPGPGPEPEPEPDEPDDEPV